MSTLLNLPHTVHYSVTTDAHPGALPRVLEQFALRNITPDLVRVSKYRQATFPDDNLCIDIHVTGLGAREQDIILQKLAVQVSVQNVRDEVLVQNKHRNLAS